MMEWLRIDVDLEIKGMDIVKHGEAAYPAQVRGASMLYRNTVYTYSAFRYESEIVVVGVNLYILVYPLLGVVYYCTK